MIYSIKLWKNYANINKIYKQNPSVRQNKETRKSGVALHYLTWGERDQQMASELVVEAENRYQKHRQTKG